jgi:hypothetical protein
MSGMLCRGQIVSPLDSMQRATASMQMLRDSGTTTLTGHGFSANIPYSWVTYRGKMKVEMKDNSYDLQFYYVNRIDSIIYLNIHLSGIELVRVVLCPDKITFVNKLSREYYEGDFRILEHYVGIPLNFFLFQSIFNGVDFPYFEANLDTLFADSGQQQFVSSHRCDTTMNSRKFCIAQAVLLTPQGFLGENHINTGSENLDLQYAKYTTYGDFPFFQEMNISVPSRQINLKAMLKVTKFNQPGPTNIHIPDSFSPVVPK